MHIIITEMYNLIAIWLLVVALIGPLVVLMIALYTLTQFERRGSTRRKEG